MSYGVLTFQRYWITAVATMATAVGMAQLPFQVDPTFQTQLLSSSTVRGVAELPDGKLLVSGWLRYPSDLQDLSVTYRLLPNGLKDNALPWAPGGGPIRPWNGKWYAGGGQGVVRLNDDGAWDMSFDIMSSYPMFNLGQGGDFSVLNDGGLVLAGSHVVNDTTRDFIGLYQLVWISNTGWLDTTRIHRKANGVLASIYQLPDGRFLTSGGGGVYDNHAVGGIIRIHPDGTVDTTFQSPALTWGYGNSFHPLPNGKTIVGGAMQFGWGLDTLNLLRLLPNGDIDPSFNSQLDIRQEHGTPYSTEGGISSIEPWGLDRLVITGYFTHVDGQVRGGIAMLDTSGYLVDDLFASTGCGPMLHPVTGEPSVNLYGLVLLSSGNLLLYGSYAGYDDGTANHPSQRAVTRLFGPTVGINEHDIFRFSLYPNPAHSYTNITLEPLPRQGQLVMRDALGRQVHQQWITGYHNTMDLQGMSTGVYVLELWVDGTREAATRLVVE